MAEALTGQRGARGSVSRARADQAEQVGPSATGGRGGSSSGGRWHPGFAGHLVELRPLESFRVLGPEVPAIRAGDEALAAGDAEEAAARYSEALSSCPGGTPGHVDALVRLGTALRQGGRVDEADGRFREALGFAIMLGDPVLQARAAIGLGRRQPYWETAMLRIGILKDALAALPDEHDLLRLTLMALLVVQLENGFHPHEARFRDELAAKLAKVVSDPTAGADVILSVCRNRIHDFIDDPETLAAVANRLVPLAEAENDLRALATGRLGEAAAALDLGDARRLRAASDAFGAIADELDDARERSQAAIIRSTIALVEGRYVDSEAESDAALRIGKLAGDFNVELICRAQGFLRASDLGLAAQILPFLTAPGAYQHISTFDAGTALCAALAGEADIAGEILDRLTIDGLGGVPRGNDQLAPKAFMAHAAVLLGARRHARGLVDALLRQPARVVRLGPIAGWWGPVDHHIGTLHAMAGDLEAAECHLRMAMDIELRMGAQPFLARTQAALSGVLSATGDRRNAVRLAAAARATAAAVGAPGVRAEVLAAVGPGDD